MAAGGYAGCGGFRRRYAGGRGAPASPRGIPAHDGGVARISPRSSGPPSLLSSSRSSPARGGRKFETHATAAASTAATVAVCSAAADAGASAGSCRHAHRHGPQMPARPVAPPQRPPPPPACARGLNAAQQRPAMPQQPQPVPPYARGLNPAQQRAVLAPLDRPLLVLAGAGSGKTSVMVRRVCRMLARGVGAPRILCVTFTRAAGDATRLVKAIGPRAKEATVSTFYALSLQICRAHAERAGYPKDFAVWQGRRQQRLLARTLAELRVRVCRRRRRGRAAAARQVGRARAAAPAPRARKGEGRRAGGRRRPAAPRAAPQPTVSSLPSSRATNSGCGRRALKPAKSSLLKPATTLRTEKFRRRRLPGLVMLSLTAQGHE